MRDEIPGLLEFADACGEDGLERVVVLGMGGSSLFPEVLDRTFGSRPDRLDLEVLDTTHPAAVARIESEWPLARTLFLAASKSGTTIETRSHLARFWADHPDPGCFAATTDPGSRLAELAEDRKFRRTFLNPPDIGGRYSALSLFGLVPAALGGISPDGLLDGAEALLPTLVAGHVDNPGLRLGAAMAAGARDGRDKLTFVLDHRIASFGLWVEQLIAESTGKQGTGIVPVVGEALGPARGLRRRPRLRRHRGAVRGRRRRRRRPGGRRPSRRTGALRSGGRRSGHRARRPGDPVGGGDRRSAAPPSGSIPSTNPTSPRPRPPPRRCSTPAPCPRSPSSLSPRCSNRCGPATTSPSTPTSTRAVVPSTPSRAPVSSLRDRLRVATTVGLGPRFLHSTGQLHKGGPPTGVFLQVVDVDDDPDADVAIPGAPVHVRRRCSGPRLPAICRRCATAACGRHACRSPTSRRSQRT